MFNEERVIDFCYDLEQRGVFNEMKVKKVEEKNPLFDYSNRYYVIEAGRHLEVKQLSNTPACHIVNLSKEQYGVVNYKTGEIEIRDKELSENRSESTKSLRESFHNLRNLIQANVLDNKKAK